MAQPHLQAGDRCFQPVDDGADRLHDFADPYSSAMVCCLFCLPCHSPLHTVAFTGCYAPGTSREAANARPTSCCTCLKRLFLEDIAGAGAVTLAMPGCNEKCSLWSVPVVFRLLRPIQVLNCLGFLKIERLVPVLSEWSCRAQMRGARIHNICKGLAICDTRFLKQLRRGEHCNITPRCASLTMVSGCLYSHITLCNHPSNVCNHPSNYLNSFIPIP